MQHEFLWAAGAVYIDIHKGNIEASKRAEEKLRYAGCPLPRNSTMGRKNLALA